ncbi:MAG TPA: asparagine synthase-related protein [Brumimicrobium sp.]|nr:asparagine synthase-related protein [Brumimicrobium sp.]
MGGILFVKGPNASIKVGEGLDIISHRGRDGKNVWEESDVSFGFVHFFIDEQSSVEIQPYVFESYVGAFNGEIYNHVEIREQYQIDISNKYDKHVILPLFSKSKDEVLSKLDGFYSGIIYDKLHRQIFLIRDHIGKKPLFYGKSNDDYFITSELKAIKHINWFKQVPCGLSTLDPDFKNLEVLKKHTTPEYSDNLFDLLQEAVIKRIPSVNHKLGVFLSGGLDSSIITALSQKFNSNTHYFILGSEFGEDSRMANVMVEKLSLRNITRVSLPMKKELKRLIKEVVYFTESYNPSIVSNGLATYLLSKEARKQGLKVVLSGEGADELFGGYYYGLDAKEWKSKQESLINDMHFTELRRLDLCSMAHSIEVRCPFLDQKVRGFAENLKIQDVFQSEMNKVLLRKTFSHILPSDISMRKKTSFDVGSGIRKMVVEFLTQNGRSEKEELYKIWREVFPNRGIAKYFHSYPVFDNAIEKRGIKHS